MTNRATYRFGGPRVYENQMLNYMRALTKGREHTLVDSVKMQSLLDDKQCVHFGREEAPSPAELQGCGGERPTRGPKKSRLTTDYVDIDNDQLRGMSICA